MATAQNKIIHRFIRPIADYEQGGTYYKRIIPVDTQAYAYYTKTEENEKEGLFYVFGDGVHTYIELREGKGRTESSKEWPVVSQEDISGKIDTLIAGANVVITGEGAERTISVPNMPIANKFLSSADLEKVEMGELLEKQYISLIKPLLNDVEIQVNDIIIYNTNEQLLVTEVDLESQTFGGVIIYVPYKDFKISFEQVEGNLLDNTSAKETLDTKLDKQNIPNKLYGIDAEGNQFLYNVTEVGIEEAPQDEKEYVRNNGAWVEIDHSKVLNDNSPSPTTTYSSLKIDTELSNLTGIEGADYIIKKAASTSTVYASSYQLYKDNVPVGEAINLPKDLFIVDGSVKEVIEDDVPVSGFKKGEKYLDLELSSSNLGHIYIRLADLGMTYIAGDGISIIGNTISMNLDILNSKADKADSLEGYGIKNAYTKSEVDMLVLHNLTYEEIL